MIQEFKEGNVDTGAIINWQIPAVTGKSIRVYAFWANNDTVVAVGSTDGWLATMTPIRNHDGTTGTINLQSADAGTAPSTTQQSPAIRFWPLEPETNPFPYVVPLSTALRIDVVMGEGGPGDGTVKASIWYDRY